MSAQYDSLLDITKSRYSCRAFEPHSVPQEDQRRILEIARQAASWCNVQPWGLHILSGAALERLRDALSAQVPDGLPDVAFPEGYEGLAQERRKEAGLRLYQALGIGREDKAAALAQMQRNFRFFDAPHVAILHAPSAVGAYAMLDCGGFAAQFCLAAQSLGVDSIIQGAIARHSRFIHQVLDIGEDRNIFCAISFGYGVKDHAANGFRTDRAEIEDFTRFVQN